jgi:hypothetical protein
MFTPGKEAITPPERWWRKQVRAVHARLLRQAGLNHFLVNTCLLPLPVTCLVPGYDYMRLVAGFGASIPNFLVAASGEGLTIALPRVHDCLVGSTYQDWCCGRGRQTAHHGHGIWLQDGAHQSSLDFRSGPRYRYAVHIAFDEQQLPLDFTTRLAPVKVDLNVENRKIGLFRRQQGVLAMRALHDFSQAPVQAEPPPGAK